MYSFVATIDIIGVNPFVYVPSEILDKLFLEAKRSKGPIPIKGLINDKPYTQTLVKYAGDWRLYVNTKMIKDSPKQVGEEVKVTIAYDKSGRSLPLHSQLGLALEQDAYAKEVFTSLSASKQHEINRYICSLKSKEKVDENVQKALQFLHGNGRFVGRERP